MVFGLGRTSPRVTAPLSFATVANVRTIAPEERERLIAAPGFGTVFTDHMVTIKWTGDHGWHDPQVRPREPFTLDPATMVLHYAQTIFEGLKAYPAEDNLVTLFRPGENARRFNASARRLAMPELPEHLFIAAIEHLVRADADWMPSGGGSLYLRPFMFADETFLGVRPAHSYVFCVIASPAGSYFKGGECPITVWVSDRYSRAAVGGTGAAKCGGNYAGSLAAQAEASLHGCDQVVFLDAAHHRWVEELGGMNIFFVMSDGSIVTPPLGTILPGITRASIISLARADGMLIEEKRYAADEWERDAANGRLREVFVCGTAATIVPVGKVCSRAGKCLIGDGEAGPVTRDLRHRLLAIQRGEAEDRFGWRHPIQLESPQEARAERAGRCE